MIIWSRTFILLTVKNSGLLRKPLHRDLTFLKYDLQYVLLFFFKKKLSSPGTSVIQDALISGFPSKDTPALLESFWLHLPCQSIFGWKHRKIWWEYDWLAEGKSTAMFLRTECGRISSWRLAFRSSCCYFLLKAAMQVPQMWFFLERVAYLQRCQHRFLQPLIVLASDKQM